MTLLPQLRSSEDSGAGVPPHIGDDHQYSNKRYTNRWDRTGTGNRARTHRVRLDPTLTSIPSLLPPKRGSPRWSAACHHLSHTMTTCGLRRLMVCPPDHPVNHAPLTSTGAENGGRFAPQVTSMSHCMPYLLPQPIRAASPGQPTCPPVTPRVREWPGSRIRRVGRLLVIGLVIAAIARAVGRARRRRRREHARHQRGYLAAGAGQCRPHAEPRSVGDRRYPLTPRPGHPVGRDHCET